MMLWLLDFGGARISEVNDKNESVWDAIARWLVRRYDVRDYTIHSDRVTAILLLPPPPKLVRQLSDNQIACRWSIKRHISRRGFQHTSRSVEPSFTNIL
jgi:hypothetical protein